MLRQVTVSQECAQFFIQNYQYLHAMLRGQGEAMATLQGRLAKYTQDQIDGYWSEMFDAYSKVQGKEDTRHIQRQQTGMVRDGR